MLSRKNFIYICKSVCTDPTWDCGTRINVLTSRLAELRKAYHSVKAELAAIDRRRKKLRRKEREGTYHCYHTKPSDSVLRV